MTRGEALVREWVADLARNLYRAAAWKTFLARSWDSSVESARADRARWRSACRWVAGGALAGGAVLATGVFSAPESPWLGAGVAWAAWYALVASFLLTHLGMLEGDAGEPRHAMHLPNGLSYLRMALAPLLGACVERVSVRSGPSIALASVIVALMLADLVDGRLARHWGVTSRLGRMLDPMADIALLTALAYGLHRAHALPDTLFVLLLVRYPGLIIVGTIVSLARGPVEIRPTRLGRATAAMSAIVLVALALARMVAYQLPARESGGVLVLLAGLLVANVLALVLGERRAVP